MRLKFDDFGMLVYRGIILEISYINIFNIFKNGEDIEEFILNEYNNSLILNRDKKLNILLSNFLF